MKTFEIIIYSLIAVMGVMTGALMVTSGDLPYTILGIIMLIASNGMLYGIVKLLVINSEEKKEKKTTKKVVKSKNAKKRKK